MAFSSVTSGSDDDSVLCSVSACKCLHSVFNLPKFPFALGIYETMVTQPGSHTHLSAVLIFM